MPLTQVIGFTESYKATQQWYVGLTFARTATGSGLGTETASGQYIRCRTATGSGSSGFDSTGLLTHIRQGSDSAGTGSSATSRVISRGRTATGSAVSSQTSYGQRSHLRTATGSGAGSASVVSFKTLFRTSSNSALSSEYASAIEIIPREATGSGLGYTSDAAVGYKFHMFRPPARNDVPTQLVGGDRIANRLARFYRPGLRGINVYKLTNATFTEVDQHDYSIVEKVYHGGHVHTLTEEEYTDLLAAGYSEYLT
jgi:hypothetical protein